MRDPDVLRQIDDLRVPGSRIGAAGDVTAARERVIRAQLALLAATRGVGVSAVERREMERERGALDRDLREREIESLGATREDTLRGAKARMRTLADRAIESGGARRVRSP